MKQMKQHQNRLSCSWHCQAKLMKQQMGQRSCRHYCKIVLVVMVFVFVPEMLSFLLHCKLPTFCWCSSFLSPPPPRPPLSPPILPRSPLYPPLPPSNPHLPPSHPLTSFYEEGSSGLFTGKVQMKKKCVSVSVCVCVCV